MSVVGWIVVGVIGLNAAFFGTLAIIWLWDEWREKHEQRKTSS